MAKINNAILYTILSVCVIGFVLTLGFAFRSEAPITEQVVVNQVSYNDSAVLTALEQVSLKVDAEVLWKAKAQELVWEDITDDDFEDLFDFLVDQNKSIYREKDIYDVEVDDYSVSNVDEGDQNADIDYDLIVRYEDESGDNKKVYVTVTAEVEEGEVEDVDYAFT